MTKQEKPNNNSLLFTEATNQGKAKTLVLHPTKGWKIMRTKHWEATNFYQSKGIIRNVGKPAYRKGKTNTRKVRHV